MALIVLAADKGAPGVTTAATALGAVWPRPVLLAECDPSGGDLAYRLPGEDVGVLNPGRGLLSLGAVARRGLRAELIYEHTQRLVGGLDVLTGLTNAEQAAGLTWLWGPLGRSLAALPGADVLADCGRLGSHPQMNDLIAEADEVVLFTRASLDHVAHLRERLTLLGRRAGVVVIADPRAYRASIEEVRRIVSGWDVTFVGGLAHDPKGAELLRGQWGGRLDRSLLIRTARDLAGRLMAQLTADVAASDAQGGTRPTKGATS
ncbi:MinD/ParA family protein [Sphaerimonospora cavernae]|uniref:MinD/ParA family protein n=1 Tax=Sphaerimonospora cavernae TaxID=1740611 RepID=A0ABV6U9N1_9ACTN